MVLQSLPAYKPIRDEQFLSVFPCIIRFFCIVLNFDVNQSDSTFVHFSWISLFLCVIYVLITGGGKSRKVPNFISKLWRNSTANKTSCWQTVEQLFVRIKQMCRFIILLRVLKWHLFKHLTQCHFLPPWHCLIICCFPKILPH